MQKENLDGMRRLVKDIVEAAENKTFIDTTINVDDLLEISKNGEMKLTRGFVVIPDGFDENGETFDICLTSTNPNKEFPLFDQLLGKKINIKISII